MIQVIGSGDQGAHGRPLDPASLSLCSVGASVVLHGFAPQRLCSAPSGSSRSGGGQLLVASGEDRRLADRQWPRFQFVRTDGRLTNLWQLRHERQMREFNLTPVLPLPVKPAPELLDQLYRPDVAHTVIPPVPGNLDELHVFRIQIDGIVVRYVEDPHAVTLTVEGQLPAATLERLVADLEDKLTRLENAPFLVRRW